MVLESLIPWAHSLIVNFSYLGIFVASLISTSTIFLPFPLYAIVFLAVGLGLNPLVTAVVAGAGSAIGELTGYFLGEGGRVVIEQKKHKRSKLIGKFIKFFEKYGFATILATSFLPFPFDFVGILSGMSNYDLKKFLLATFIGKTGKILLISYAGYLVGPYIHVLINSVF